MVLEEKETAGIPILECSVRFDELPVCVRVVTRVRMRMGVCGYAGTCARA